MNKFKTFFLFALFYLSVSIFSHDQKLSEVRFFSNDDFQKFIRNETVKIQNIKHLNFVYDSVLIGLPVDFYDKLEGNKKKYQPLINSPLIDKDEIEEFFKKELQERAPSYIKFHSSPSIHSTHTNYGLGGESATVYLFIEGKYDYINGERLNKKNEMYSEYFVWIRLKESRDWNPLDIYETYDGKTVPSDKLDEELKQTITLLIERFYAVHKYK